MSDQSAVTPSGSNELMNFGCEITHRLFLLLDRLDRSYPRIMGAAVLYHHFVLTLRVIFFCHPSGWVGCLLATLGSSR